MSSVSFSARLFPDPRGLALATLLLLAAGRAELTAQQKSESYPNPPPMAQGGTVEVQRGEAVDIPLNSQGRYGETVNFILRSNPRYGTLSAPHRVDRASGSIRYQHGGQTDHIEDSFTFATQASGTPVSAPAKITIRITDPPPALSAEARLSFGPTPVGEAEKRILKVKNIGGLPLSSKLDVKPPFSFEEGFNPSYTLQGGQTLEVPLIFRPTMPGESSSILKLGEGRTELTLLRGEATAPFSLAPDRLNLRNTPRDLSAPITVTNSTPNPLKLKVKWPWGFSGDEEINVPGNGSQQLLVQVTGKEPTEFEGKLEVSLERLTLETGLRALSLPGQLEAPDEVDFGLVGNPAEGMKQVRVKNVGGGPLMLEVRREGGFVAPDLKEVLPLQADQFTDIAVYPPQNVKKGEWTGKIILWETGKPEHVIRLKGEIGSSGDRVAPAARAVSGQRVASDKTVFLNEAPPAPTASEASPAKRTWDPEEGIPRERALAIQERRVGPNAGKFMADRQQAGMPIRKVKVIAVSANTLTLSWPKSPLPASEIGLQRQVLKLDSSQNLDREWLPVQSGGVDRGIETDMMRAAGLEPGRSYTLRLVHLAPGSQEQPALSASFTARTTPKPPPFYARSGFRNTGLFLLLGAVVAGYVWFRFFRGASSQ